MNEPVFILGKQDAATYGINPTHVTCWFVLESVLYIFLVGMVDPLLFKLPDNLGMLDYLKDNSLDTYILE